jgi:23S rRNA pseudouridine1911/1915/1917 synthase
VKMRVIDSGRDALSHVSLVKFYGGYSHIAVEIETGRTHQIRVHLSHQKLPIIGDRLYNSRNLIAKNTSQNLIKHIQSFPRQALHASKIRFPAIKGASFFEFQVEIPDDMKSLIEKM